MHPRYAPYLFSLVLSGIMTFIVTCIATYRASEVMDGFVALWLSSWVAAWLVAYPAMLVAAPLVRRAVEGLVRPPHDRDTR